MKFGLGALVVFGIVYPGVVKELPSMLDGEIGGTRNPAFAYIPVLLLAAAGYGIYYSAKHRKRILNVALLSFVLIVLGYSTYAMVFIRAKAHPPMNENDPSTLTRLVSYLNREQYGSAPLIERRWDNDPEKLRASQQYASDMDFFLRYQLDHMYWRYHMWNYVGAAGDEKDAGWSAKEFFFIPLILGFFGAWYHWKKDWKMASVATAFFLLMGFALVVYFNMQAPQPRERDYFYVGSFFIFSMWIGFALVGLIDILRERLASLSKPQYLSYGILGLGFLLVPANMLRVNYRQANRAGNYVAWDYSYNLLQSCEKDAILFTQGDNDTFPLWYLQDVEGIRRDIRIVNLSLVNTSWYIKALKNEQPYGSLKVPISLQDAQIDQIRPMAFEPRMMELPTTAETARRMLPEGESITLDTSISNSGVLRWYMPNTIEFGGLKGIRTQDIIVYDIVRTSNWQRPIYFAMTVGDDSKIGLRDYMEMRGIAFKFVPRRQTKYYENLDERVMTAHLMTDVETPSKEPAFGFRWRGLQERTTYFDEDVKRLMSNYRNAYLSLAIYYANVRKDQPEAISVLDRMEQLMPRKVLPIDTRLKLDLGSLYAMAQDTAKQREYWLEVVSDLEPIAAQHQKEQIGYYSNYIMLFNSYLGLGMYEKASGLVNVLKEVYAGEQGIDSFIAQLNAQVEAQRRAHAMSDTGDVRKGGL